MRLPEMVIISEDFIDESDVGEVKKEDNKFGSDAPVVNMPTDLNAYEFKNEIVIAWILLNRNMRYDDIDPSFWSSAWTKYWTIDQA
mmetsp:Transcript_11335/g.12848  ORF Transcript_11335/g.12848 Transcript_11335/m.12848 type:complete len:86 (-) Transcript_11335:152-409(-)